MTPETSKVVDAGPSTYAAGNQACRGKRGNLTPNARIKPSNNHPWTAGEKDACIKTGISVVPVFTHIHKIPIIINKEPANVNRKNCKEAKIRFGPPQIPINMLLGSRVAS